MKMSASFSSHACVANNGVRKLTEVFSFGSLLFQLMVLATLSGLAWAVPPPSELAGPNQLAAALADAKRIEFSGRIPDMRDPNNPGERIKLAQLPCVLERPEDIRQVSAFFAGAKLKEDKEMTQVFREGATLSAAIYVQIVIDEKSSFTILSSTLCLFADDVTYVAHGFDDQPEHFFPASLCSFSDEFKKPRDDVDGPAPRVGWSYAKLFASFARGAFYCGSTSFVESHHQSRGLHPLQKSLKDPPQPAFQRHERAPPLLR